MKRDCVSRFSNCSRFSGTSITRWPIGSRTPVFAIGQEPAGDHRGRHVRGLDHADVLARRQRREVGRRLLHLASVIAFDSAIIFFCGARSGIAVVRAPLL